MIDQVALTGDTAPGTGGLVYTNFIEPVLNNVGDVAFSAFFEDPVGGGNGRGVFGPLSGAGSAIGPVARDGQAVPAVSGDVNYAQFFGGPALSDDGGIAFSARLFGADVGPDNDRAVLGPSPAGGSALQVVGREDQPAPGAAAGVAYGNFFDVTLAPSGRLIYGARLRTDPNQSFNDQSVGVFMRDAGVVGAPVLLLERGQNIDLAGEQLQLGGFAGERLDRGGSPLVVATFRAADGSALSMGVDRAALRLDLSSPGNINGAAIREGDAAPGVADATIEALEVAVSNANGDVAWRSRVRPAGSVETELALDEAIFGPINGAGSSVGLLAREGDAAGPGTGRVFTGFLDLSLNALGQTVFGGRTRDASSTSGPSDTGLFAFRGGEIFPLVSEGDLIETWSSSGTTQLREVSFIDFDPAGLNDQGELVFGLDFVDGEEGVFRLSLSQFDPATGDYNNDGFVSQADLDLVLLNWGDSLLPDGFFESALGGIGFDGQISQNELDGVLLNWGENVAPALVVPEPGVGMVVLALAVFARQRRVPG